MTTRVLMLSHLQDWERSVGGIGTVVRAYFKYLPKYDITLVDKYETNFDVLAVHAGMAQIDKTNIPPIVAHIHGLYWTGEYAAEKWEYSANRNVIDSMRIAHSITVPTSWVAKPIQRDMRLNPIVVPHGIDIEEWEHNEEEEPYILAYGKNRVSDVCNPEFLTNLAMKMGDIKFLTTFAPRDAPKNVVEIGLQKPEEMKKIIQRSMLVLSPIEETFGMLTLEALASGKPVVGVDIGGNLDLIQHGVNGFLYQNNNIDHMAQGIEWALRFRKDLGKNARDIAQKYSWDAIAQKIASIYINATRHPVGAGEVSIVIPCYNYANKLQEAVESCLAQTYQPKEIIIVNDGSKDNTDEIGNELQAKHNNIHFISVENGGVARARNIGIQHSSSEFVMCLDADDCIAPEYIRACIGELKNNPRIDISYSKLKTITPDGKETISQWPDIFNADAQLTPRNEGNLRGLNQIPTAAIFRRSAWERVGGYDPRFSPLGAGAEDAEFWTRIIASGGEAKLATTAPLFIYSYQTGMVSGAKGKNHDLIEPFWLINKPWIYSHHPFASQATPTRISHRVHSYKNPLVSIIIPVGKGHEEIVRNAINSIEGQSFSNWELIIVWDSPNPFPHFKSAYPYAQWIHLNPETNWEERKSYGAGYARNIGAKNASSSSEFLIFLDADDELHHHYLSKTLDIYREETGTIVYTDYARKFHASRKDVYDNNEGNNILSYYDETEEAIVRGYAQDFDCELAQSQINDIHNRQLYHWALVTCLIPKKWHNEIGGFPEDMHTFEDVYYHWAMARMGKCYTRIEEPLVLYNMDTGKRRSLGSPDTEETKRMGQLMLELARNKLKGVKMAGCSKCPGNRSETQVVINTPRNATPENIQLEEGMIFAEYLHPNRGTHRVVGKGTGKDYGYRAGGTRFVVFRKDMEAQPSLFREIHRSNEVKIEREPNPIPNTPLKIPNEKRIENATNEISVSDIDLQEIPGINSTLAAELKKHGIETTSDVANNINILESLIGKERTNQTIEAITSYQKINVNMDVATDLFEQYKENYRED